MLNVFQATKWLSQNQTIQLTDEGFKPCSRQQRIQRVLFSGEDKRQIQRIADFIQGKVAHAEGEAKNQYLKLADAFIKHYQRTSHGKKITQAFDRTIVQYRPEVTFMHSKNQQNLQKWVRNGQSEEIYHHHPEFCLFLESSGLLSQMKVTRDTIKEIDGEAAMIVDGKWMKWSDVKQQFEAIYSERYKEKFIVNKKTFEVFTYLDNGKGLQLHHPFLSEKDPASTLNETEYQKVLDVAQTFVRKNEADLTSDERQKRNAERPFIIQLVSSHVKGPNTRFHELVVNSKHPYLRLIIGKDNSQLGTHKGEVYEVGFGWKNKVTIPFVATQGRFRSPDIWEYGACEERVVTNIPVTAQEALAFTQFTTKYHRNEVNIGNSIGFHLIRQNCSTYVRTALEAAGIEAPTLIPLSDLIQEIAPAWLAKVGDFFKAVHQKSRQGMRCVVSLLPESMQQGLKKSWQGITAVVKRALEALAAISIAPVNVALGGTMGEGGAAFVTKTNAKPEKIRPSMFNVKEWFSLKKYRFNLPGVLQTWQREQASTVIYKNPIKLSIVP